MNIGILMLVKISQRLDHRARFLRSRSAIEINQRMPMRTFAKNREILAERAPIHTAGSELVHIIICSMRCYAPPLFQRVESYCLFSRGGTRCPQRVVYVTAAAFFASTRGLPDRRSVSRLGHSTSCLGHSTSRF